MTLLDSQGKKINGTKPYADPRQEFGNVIRLVETAHRKGTAELCAQLEEAHKAGYNLTIDEDVPPTLAEIKLVISIRRDANGQVLQHTARHIVLGPDYTEALTILKKAKECQTPISSP